MMCAYYSDTLKAWAVKINWVRTGICLSAAGLNVLLHTLTSTMLISGVECFTCYVTGRLKVTDVMFPSGSPALVEPIYSNPLLSAPFNEQLAAAVVGYVKQRLQVRNRALLEHHHQLSDMQRNKSLSLS